MSSATEPSDSGPSGLCRNKQSAKLQRRGERRATISEEVGGVYDVKVLYRGYVQLTNTKNSKTNVYTYSSDLISQSEHTTKYVL